MKYVISNTGEVRTGEANALHCDLAKDISGKVVAAGHFVVNNAGKVSVFGESLGFRIKSDPRDAAAIERHLKTIVSNHD